MKHQQHSKRIKVLVIDDDPDIRSVLEEILSMEDVDVVVAEDGEDALSRIRDSEKPDLVLLDLSMPVKDGYDFLKEREASGLLESVPVVIMSGNDQSKGEPLLSEAAAILRKPFEIDELLKTVRRLSA